MANPSHVRLVERLNRGIVADVEGGSGWSIAGLDVKEFPNAEDEPVAAAFVERQLRQGKLEAATSGEYQDVQAANDTIAEAAAFNPDAGESLNEAAVQAAVRKASKELSQAAAARADSESEEDEYDGLTRDELRERAAAAGVDLPKNVSRADALAAVRGSANAE